MVQANRRLVRVVLGVLLPVAAALSSARCGYDPEIPAGARTRCKTDADCMGAGACVPYPANPRWSVCCFSPACDENHPPEPDGGARGSLPATDGPAEADGNGSDGSRVCSREAPCPSDHRCFNGFCRPYQVDGTACGGDYDCLSLHCVHGVCCNAKCASGCLRCDVEGSVGTCKQVLPPGADCGSLCVNRVATRATCDAEGRCNRIPTPCAEGETCGPLSCMPVQLPRRR